MVVRFDGLTLLVTADCRCLRLVFMLLFKPLGWGGFLLLLRFE